MESDDIKLKSRWAAIVHLFGFFIFASFLLLFALFDFLDFNPLPIFIFVLPAIFAVNLFWFWGSKKSLWGIFSFYIFLAFNLVATTAIIHFSGGQDSTFPFLYLITVISATLISSRASAIIAVISLSLFIIIAVEPPAGIQLPSLIRILRLVLLGSVISFQGYYFISRIRGADKRLLELKNQFIFRTVHDVRSPTTSIQLLLEKYKKPKFKEKYPEIQEDLILVDNAIKRVLDLAERLLNLARGEKEKFNLKPVDLTTAINEILQEVQSVSEKKNIHTDYNSAQKLDPVLADPELLKEVLANLIGNAVKYNSEGGKLSIWHTTHGNFIKTHILNTGPKIPPEMLEKLFTPYFRGETGLSGTGLGLYITKEIIDRFGGEVGVESSTDEGTVFYITLPIAND